VSVHSAAPSLALLKVVQSHLFLHHILLHYLEAGSTDDAVTFASYYKELTFFAHALEILLHTIVEAEADLESIETEPMSGVLPTVIEFLDYFDAALDVVVGCARKTEMTRWRRLFDIVGNPKTLFEVRRFRSRTVRGSVNPDYPDMSSIGSPEDCRFIPTRSTQPGATGRKTQPCCPVVIQRGRDMRLATVPGVDAIPALHR
jgi:hypothetical protein